MLAKLLARARKGDRTSGFTLAEVLVVVVIISILSVLSVPSILNQIARAREAEAKLTIGSVNRGQQIYRTTNSSFAQSFDELAIGLDQETSNYTYGGMEGNDATQGVVTATPADPATVVPFGGGVFVQPNSSLSAIICEGTLDTFAAAPTDADTCPTAYNEL